MPLKVLAATAIAAALTGAAAFAQQAPAESFPAEQVSAGAEIYAVNCSPCHGVRLQSAGTAADLKNFPGDRTRFFDTVTGGKGQMPPWGDFFKPNQLEELWAYIKQGERN